MLKTTGENLYSIKKVALAIYMYLTFESDLFDRIPWNFSF